MVLQNKLNLEVLKKMRQDIAEDINFNPRCTLLIDIRLAKLHVSIKELKEFGKWFGLNSKMNPKNKKSFLTSNPDQVVKSLIFTAISYFSSFKTFSTVKACVKHLEIDIANVDMIEKEINKMSDK